MGSWITGFLLGRRHEEEYGVDRATNQLREDGILVKLIEFGVGRDVGKLSG
jgi:hypothetical protein